MMARIRELEKENQRLNHVVSGIKRQACDRRNIIPYEIGIKHGGHPGSGGYFCFPDMQYDDLQILSMAIRGICFPRHFKEKHRQGKTRKDSFRVGVREMTDEEYKKYSEVVDQIIGVLVKYTYHPEDKTRI